MKSLHLRNMELTQQPYYHHIQKLMLTVYILQQLLAHPSKGVSRKDITNGWHRYCEQNDLPFHLSRQTFIREVEQLRQLNLKVEYVDHRYRLLNAYTIHHNPLFASTVSSLSEFLLINAFRHLGSAIQPEVIEHGNNYLFPLATAIDQRIIVEVDYEKFQNESMKKRLHPYCLKAIQGRWYLLAYEEENAHDAQQQMYGLDRIKKVNLTTDRYTPPAHLNLGTFFDDFFGAYTDTNAPMEAVELMVSPHVKPYLDTLPIHQSQQYYCQHTDGRHLYHLHLRITPDFCNELQRWGASIEVIAPQHLRDEMRQRFQKALDLYM